MIDKDKILEWLREHIDTTKSRSEGGIYNESESSLVPGVIVAYEMLVTNIERGDFDQLSTE